MFPHPSQSCSPAVGRGNDQCVAHAGPPEAAAQLVEEAVGQRLQGQDNQQGAEEQAVGGLQIREKNKTKQNTVNNQNKK